MSVRDCQWVSVSVRESWVSMSVRECQWVSESVSECQWVSVSVSECQWVSESVSGCHWVSVSVSEFWWVSVTNWIKYIWTVFMALSWPTPLHPSVFQSQSVSITVLLEIISNLARAREWQSCFLYFWLFVCLPVEYVVLKNEDNVKQDREKSQTKFCRITKNGSPVIWKKKKIHKYLPHLLGCLQSFDFEKRK